MADERTIIDAAVLGAVSGSTLAGTAYAGSNSTSQSSGTYRVNSLFFEGRGGASVGVSNGSIIISGGAGGAGDGYNIVAVPGTTAGASATIVFSNSNGVSFGIGGSTVTASHNGLTTAALSNHSHGNPTLNLTNLSGTTASNSAGFTLSLSAAAPGGGAVVSNAIQTVGSNTGSGTNTSRFAADDHVHAGVGQFQISGNTSNTSNVVYGSLVLAGGPNVTLSQVSAAGGATVTISAAAGLGGAAGSYFAWPGVIANSSAVQISGSTKYVQPIAIPYDLSVSFARFPLTLSCVGSMASIATSAGHTVGMTLSSTIQLAFYSRGTGGSSLSLQSYYTTSTLWLQQATIGAAGVGSNWSSGHTISFPNASGANSSFTSSAATTLTNRTIQSSQLSDFTALRFFHIPMATSFSAGVWWMAYNSSTSISTSGNANISTVRILASNFAVSQPAQSINVMGAATNSSHLFPVGAGDWSTNSIGTTTGSIQLAALSRRASNPIIYFDMGRIA